MNDAEVKLQVKIDDSTASKSVDTLTKKTDNLSKSFTNAGKKLTLGLTVPIAGLIGVGIKYNAQIEQLQTSFEVMTGSADKASEVIEKLKKAGAETPYELTGLAKTTQTLMQYGLTADEAYDATMNFGDIAQGSAEKMQSIALAYGQMSSLGKVNMQDIKQMINAGFNPLQAIAEMTGETMAQVNERYEEGKISVEEVTKAMEYASSENGRYYQSMEKQSQTLEGRMNALKEGFNEASGELTKSLLPIMEQLMTKVTNLVTWFNSLTDGQKKTIMTILGIVAAVGPMLLIFAQVVSAITAISKATWLFNGALLASPITWIVVGIVALIAIIVLLVANFDKIKAVVSTVWTVIKDVFGKIGSFIANIFKGIINAYISMYNLLIKGLNLLIKGFLSPFNLIIKGLNLVPGVKIPLLKFAIPNIPKLEVGTNYVAQEGLAYLHQGEAVVPKKYNPAIGGGSFNNQQIMVEMPDIIIDGNKIGRAVTPYVTKTVKLSGGNV